MKNRILCIGDIMLDVTVKVPTARIEGREIRSRITLNGGGAGANVATWLAAHQNQVYLIARVGNDMAGKVLRDDLDNYQIEYDKNLIVNQPTGAVVVIVEPNGERTMYPNSGANQGLSPADLPKEMNFAAAYLSGYSLVNPDSRQGTLEIIDHLRKLNIPIWFDPATVGIMSEVSIKTILEWIKLMDFLCLNEEEAQFLSGKSNIMETLDFLLDLTPTVVIKRGSTGAIGKQRNKEFINLPAKKTEVIDSTGAGDSFMAGLISQYLIDNNLESAIDNANDWGARCVAKIGSRPLVAHK